MGERASMKIVYKYDILDGITQITLPKGAELLMVSVQQDIPRLWALVELTGEEESRRIVFYGTGYLIPDKPTALRFINTFFWDVLVFHAFEVVI